MKSENTVKHI